MPGLDREDLKRLRMQMEICRQCTNWELHNYCRECDEFFIYGHAENCKLNPHQHEKHKGHRTY